MHSRNLQKNLKNCSPTVMHLTYVFWQTSHLMDQTWHFCISTMAWQFWYPEFPRLLVVRDLPTRSGSVAEPPKLYGPHALDIVLKTSDYCTWESYNLDSLSGALGGPRIIHIFFTHTGSTWSYHNIITFVTKELTSECGRFITQLTTYDGI